MKALIVGLATLGLVGAILVALRFLVFVPYSVNSKSMEPSFDKGQYVVVVNRPFASQVARGDVIMFHLTLDGRPSDYLKRVIGLPGDRVQLKNNQVYVNGAAFTQVPVSLPPDPEGIPGLKGARETNVAGRQYLIETLGPQTDAGNTEVYVTPPNCYFVLGDSRDNSLDSRFAPATTASAADVAACPWPAGSGLSMPPEGFGFVPDANVSGTVQWTFGQRSKAADSAGTGS